MATSLQTLKGFRDFLPAEMLQRHWVKERVVKAFEQSGFAPLETPTLEYRETIMGKYGAEADKLVYQFVDNGEREVAMRYDQTVPLARVVAQYRNDIPLPFRRYQIQNVFRADKPQKGRYREFTQCDIDLLGSTDPLADAEVLATTYAVFRELGMPQVELRVNDRQVLFAALAPFATAEVSVQSIIQSVDKLDKMSVEAVESELVAKGLATAAAQAALSAIQAAQPSENLAQILSLTESLGVPAPNLVFASTIARGLDYYTGMIFEIILPGTTGSLGGGGRYDGLIEQLSGFSVPAVGVGLGFDRIVEAAVTLELVPTNAAVAQVLVTVFDESLRNVSASAAAELRAQGLRVELYPGAEKLGKQFKYADRVGISYAVVIGPEEVTQQRWQLKNLKDGSQQALSPTEVMSHVAKSL